MVSLHHHPRQNRILGALGVEEFSRLEAELERIELAGGQVLCEQGGMIGFVYFPTTARVSLLATTAGGGSAELAMTGIDGMVGVPVVLGGETSPQRIVAQGPGTAYRLRAELLRWELDQGRGLQRLCLRYALALMGQMAQIAVCNRHHAVEQQFCRWLLLNLEQTSGDEIPLTQAQIAVLLGRRREAVTLAAGALQTAGLIDLRRGRIMVRDRRGLERLACECYRIIRDGSAHLLQAPPEMLHRHPLRPNPGSLRRLAEARLQDHPPPEDEAGADPRQLLRDLRVHQIELEIRNEELAEAYATADRLRHRYADIYDFAPVAYVSIDALGAIRQINLAGAILLGIRRSQVARHRFDDHVAEADLPRFREFVTAVLHGQGKRKSELALRASEQRGVATVAIEAIPDENGEECRMVIADVTAERRARDRERLLVSALEAVGNGVVITDPEGRIEWVNPAFERLTGYAREDAVGHNPAALIKSGFHDAGFYENMWSTILSARTWTGELVNARKGGALYHAELTVAPVLDAAGTIRHFVGIQHDISDRKRLEVQLKNLSRIDLLTGLPNRAHFIARADEELARLRRGVERAATLAVVEARIATPADAADATRDDPLLRAFAAWLCSELQPDDVAGRVDQRLFALLLPAADQRTALADAARLRALLADESSHLLPVHVAAGITHLSAADPDSVTALIRAIAALAPADD